MFDLRTGQAAQSTTLVAAAQPSGVAGPGVLSIVACKEPQRGTANPQGAAAPPWSPKQAKPGPVKHLLRPRQWWQPRPLINCACHQLLAERCHWLLHPPACEPTLQCARDLPYPLNCGCQLVVAFMLLLHGHIQSWVAAVHGNCKDTVWEKGNAGDFQVQARLAACCAHGGGWLVGGCTVDHAQTLELLVRLQWWDADSASAAADYGEPISRACPVTAPLTHGQETHLALCAAASERSARVHACAASIEVRKSKVLHAPKCSCCLRVAGAPAPPE